MYFHLSMVVTRFDFIGNELFFLTLENNRLCIYGTFSVIMSLCNVWVSHSISLPVDRYCTIWYRSDSTI